MIRTGNQNADIVTPNQCSMNTVKAARRHIDSCNGDYVAVTSRKVHSRCSDYVYMP